MTDEQIEKASWDFSDSQRLSTEDDRATAYAKAFKAGAHFALASQWISVEERLPEDINPNLVYVEDIGISPELSHTIAYYEKGAWHFLDSYYYDCKISHWLPIPELNPEKEER